MSIKILKLSLQELHGRFEGKLSCWLTQQNSNTKHLFDSYGWEPIPAPSRPSLLQHTPPAISHQDSPHAMYLGRLDVIKNSAIGPIVSAMEELSLHPINQIPQVVCDKLIASRISLPTLLPPEECWASIPSYADMWDTCIEGIRKGDQDFPL